MMLQEVLAVLLGGGLGSVLRFLVSRGVQLWIGASFPYGILSVNVLGSFLMGFLSLFLIKGLGLGPLWRIGILVGFLGGFTTFSSFSMVTYELFANGMWLSACVNIFFSVLLCLVAVGLGLALANFVTH